MDDQLRGQARALRARPDDEETRLRTAQALLRAGRKIEACAALGIRWDVDAGGLWQRERPLWRGQRVEREALLALVDADLVRLDPLALAAAFPKRADGRWRGNTTRFLVRYPAAPAASPHRRIVLFAWTAGTGNRAPRGAGSRLHLSLDTRSTQADFLPEATWTS